MAGVMSRMSVLGSGAYVPLNSPLEALAQLWRAKVL